MAELIYTLLGKNETCSSISQSSMKFESKCKVLIPDIKDLHTDKAGVPLFSDQLDQAA